ncbi:MAG TPA: hypothetical protein VK196_01725 [Magnetospirillum sp.]|nr:hypothetical protein [Magnetospirillum sp.]
MYFALSAVSALVALFMLKASSNAHMAASTVFMWVLAFAFFIGALFLAKKGMAARAQKKLEQR